MTASIINKTIKSIVAASAALIMAASVAACGPNAATPSEENNASNGGATTSKVTARSLDEIKKSGVLKVAVFSDKAPFGYIDKDGKNAGYDIVFAERLAKDLGVKVKYTSVDPAARVDVLTSNKVDITLANFTVTDERKQSVDFSTSYATGIQSIVVKEDSPITSADDLYADGADYQIGVQQDTTGDIYCSDDFGDDHVQRFNKGADAVAALVSGKLDCVVIDNEPAKSFVAANEGLKVLDTAYAVEDYAAAFAKGSELTEPFNKALEELIADGTVQKIVDKYISAD